MTMRIPGVRYCLVNIFGGYSFFFGKFSAAGMNINSIVYRMP
jgi:hypothetical protein